MSIQGVNEAHVCFQTHMTYSAEGKKNPKTFRNKYIEPCGVCSESTRQRGGKADLNTQPDTQTPVEKCLVTALCPSNKTSTLKSLSGFSTILADDASVVRSVKSSSFSVSSTRSFG
ncbi:hypothetical protein ATANTOWER_012703 [Ataeniobius toweri]|uniref:Uncharacterized protein n=1 Tax=Ataeniobius toweri TaxID=208326 RepID=A0ABU7CAU8_9TELE|nr:hypothetical protein [Ataeniobius toweri]